MSASMSEAQQLSSFELEKMLLLFAKLVMIENTNAPVRTQDFLDEYQSLSDEIFPFNTIFSMLRVHKEVVDAEISMKISNKVNQGAVDYRRNSSEVRCYMRF